MSALNPCPSIGFFYLLLLLSALSPHFALAQPGKLALFLNDDCSTPSQIAPSVSLALSTCLVTLGVNGVAIQAFPPCSNGTANFIMYQDTSCARSDYNDGTGSYTGNSDGSNCFYNFVTFSIPAVMFTCEDPKTDPQATSTSTVTASAIAGVAAPTSSPTAVETGDSALTTATDGNTALTTATGGNTALATATGGESTATSGTNAAPSASSTGSSGLSTSDKIAVGVGLGVGIPTILISLLAWCYPRLR